MVCNVLLLSSICNDITCDKLCAREKVFYKHKPFLILVLTTGHKALCYIMNKVRQLLCPFMLYILICVFKFMNRSFVKPMQKP